MVEFSGMKLTKIYIFSAKVYILYNALPFARISKKAAVKVIKEYLRKYRRTAAIIFVNIQLGG